MSDKLRGRTASSPQFLTQTGVTSSQNVVELQAGFQFVTFWTKRATVQRKHVITFGAFDYGVEGQHIIETYQN